jgi:hypothetical protein
VITISPKGPEFSGGYVTEPIENSYTVDTFNPEMVTVPSLAPHDVGSVSDTVNVGNGFTVIVPADATLEHPVEVFVNVISAVPADIPVTTPPFVISAILLSLLDQVPPVVGVRLNDSPTHTSPLFGTVTVGIEFTVKVTLPPVALLHPLSSQNA